MCVCVYACVCVCVYVYVCMYMYMRFIKDNKALCVSVYARVYVCGYVCACIRTDRTRFYLSISSCLSICQVSRVRLFTYAAVFIVSCLVIFSKGAVTCQLTHVMCHA